MSMPLQFTIPKLANNEPSDGTNIVLTIQMNKFTIPRKTEHLGDQLYKRVVSGDYEAAVTKTLRLQQEDNSQVIMETVNKLLNDGKRNVVEFAYKLWNMFGKDIVIDYFPPEFRMLFNEESVVFINKKYEVPITLNSNTDEKNETLAIAYTPNHRLECVLKAIWEDNRVYFKIVSPLRHQNLKLKPDSYTEGNFACIGAEYNTYNQHWYLQPLMYEGDLLFYITNREYKRVLKFSDNLDKDNCRYLYGYKVESINTPEIFGWYIKPF